MIEQLVATISGKRATTEIVDDRVAMQAQADEIDLTLSAADVQPLSEDQSVAALRLSGDGFNTRVELTADALKQLEVSCDEADESLEGDR